jgi:hypothetical protein
MNRELLPIPRFVSPDLVGGVAMKSVYGFSRKPEGAID